MKRYLLFLLLIIASMVSAKALSYNEARERAWYLTDKMAYELNLTAEQYDCVYQINLDYFMQVTSPQDIYGYYWNYRDEDLRYILYDWQYQSYMNLDYFFRPLRWYRSTWQFPILSYYNRSYYYYQRPTIYITYQGGFWRRGHNDVSPYRDWRPSTYYVGGGMRDRYMQDSFGNQGIYRGGHNDGAYGRANGNFGNERFPNRNNNNQGQGFGGRRDMNANSQQFSNQEGFRMGNNNTNFPTRDRSELQYENRSGRSSFSQSPNRSFGEGRNTSERSYGTQESQRSFNRSSSPQNSPQQPRQSSRNVPQQQQMGGGRQFGR